uniref:Uncharacterized protein n=1 Tax=Rhizophora mucronata TaxID=61149 RepID=A0A2P2MTT9_RHIMU
MPKWVKNKQYQFWWPHNTTKIFSSHTTKHVLTNFPTFWIILHICYTRDMANLSVFPGINF